ALYSIIELATAFSPNFTVFLILRVIFGIAMGGEWGLGSALAMEALPSNRRGLFSGLLQSGYNLGNLLAGLTLWLLFERIGWRGMFVIGALPALLILYIRAHVPESAVWEAKAGERLALVGDAFVNAFKRYLPLFVYGILFMSAMNFMAHSLQDLYPTFLTIQRGFSPSVVGQLNSITAFGAICGGIFCGWFSQRIGRRYTIVIVALCALALVPLWVFGATFTMLALGGFAIQFAAQGAWGVIPAHLNEIAPPLARGTFPGFVYQLGNLIASPVSNLIAWLAVTHFGSGSAPNYAQAMAVVASISLVAVAVFALLGFIVRPESRDESFNAIVS
ncbi:MAG TPA: MFS transporter, partial [Candidatus Baltobacteraceae bacterium]|nr:MFS transporter [Candidatus Baltobacteraceae bacterium]